MKKTKSNKASIVNKKPAKQVEWIALSANKKPFIGDMDIRVNLKKFDDPSRTGLFLIIMFKQKVLDHLKAKLGDKIVLMSDPDDIFHYLLIKSQIGYTVSISSKNTPDTIRLQMKIDIKGLEPFKAQNCETIFNNNGSIELFFPRS